MFDVIDNYCERVGPGFLAEPLNALTNLSFFIAAFFAFALAKRINALDWGSGLLIVLTFVMGTGSTLFHTYAQVWAMLADVLPILFYQICFIALYSNRVIACRCRLSMALLGVFFALMWLSMQAPREWLNGSLEYAPAWLFLGSLGLWHWKNAAKEPLGLLAAFGVFTVSLTFRSVDSALCESLPSGTHFLWHICNGVVLYLTTRAYVLNAGGGK